MKNKINHSEGNRQADVLENFPNLSTKSVKQLAELFYQAEVTGDGILISRIIAEVRQREPLFTFSYLEFFVNKLWAR